MPKLSKRLEAIASLVPQGAYLADVGSDHGYLPIALVQNRTIRFAEAIDNKLDPYLRMKRNVENAGLSNNIVCSMSSGLDDLNDGVTCLAICGIGGLLTCDILEKEPQKLVAIDTIILDPHTDLGKVRQRVSKLGYHLTQEKMVYDDKIYYTIMKWEKGSPNHDYSDDELLFGPCLMKSRPAIYLEWLEVQRKKISDILNAGLPKEKREYYLDLYRRVAGEIKRT